MRRAIGVITLMATAATSAAADRPWRDIAVETGRWIESVAIETEHGLGWPRTPGQDETPARNLYHGSPGVILFLLELHRATDDTRWLDLAKRGADDLIGSFAPDADPFEAPLWTGVAGRGLALVRVGEATGDARYDAGARAVFDAIAARRIDTEAGPTWNEVTDIVAGSAGIGLALLDAAEKLDEPKYVALATEIGRELQSRAREHADGAELEWAMSETFPRLMPNHSHGTAGISFYLARLHQVTGERDFLDSALRGAQRLLTIADADDESFLVHHHTPDGEDLFYLGWCHGPAGTGRLFRLLQEITGDETWKSCADRGVTGILATGIPERTHPGLWNTVSACCGTAGICSWVALQDGVADERRDAFLDAMTADLVEASTTKALESGTARYWIQAEHRVRPEEVMAQTGIMHGAVGVGLWFLQLDAMENGREFGTSIPGGPYERGSVRRIRTTPDHPQSRGDGVAETRRINEQAIVSAPCHDGMHGNPTPP